MKLHVDWTACDGRGVCASLLPSVVRVDDWGYPLLPAALPPALEDAAGQAVDLCPALALTLIRDPAPASS